MRTWRWPHLKLMLASSRLKVVIMFTKLGGKFEVMRTELEKEETNARHAFEMLSQDLKAQIDQSTQARRDGSCDACLRKYVQEGGKETKLSRTSL